MTSRRTSSSRNRSVEGQLTRSFNKLVSKNPVAAAIVLIVVAVGAWFFLRGGDDAPANASSPISATSTTAAGSAATKSDATPKATTAPKSSAATKSSAAKKSSTTPKVDKTSGLPVIAESALPPTAQQILDDIRAGGPFEFEQDGATFGNYEGILPKKEGGYYHEYTVQMPGDATRGAHRFVTGAGGEIYYTDDHYESFSVVAEGT